MATHQQDESAPSPREQLQLDFIAWLHDRRDRWSAPYGILDGKSGDGKYRTVTFGIARALDAELRIYGPRYFVLHSSAEGWLKFTSYAALIAYLSERHLGAAPA